MTDLNTGSGVDYNKLDKGKLGAQDFARMTDGNLSGRFDIQTFLPSTGQSVFLMREGNHYRAYLIEGLGTLNLVADAYQLVREVPGARYDVIGYSTVASIINDLLTAGALPIVVGQYLALEKGEWLDEVLLRAEALNRGFKEGCDDARCIWGPGETPGLKGIIVPGTIDIAGFAVGRTPGLKPWCYERLVPGDAIVFLESSGLHMNGVTAIREDVVPKLPDGYATIVPGTGGALGDELLVKAHIYLGAVAFALEEGFDVHYATHISGHGLRKLMRAPQDLTYVVETLPTEQPLFPYLQEQLGYDDKKMCSSYNEGVGFALFMPERDAGRFVRLGNKQGWPYHAFVAGRVEAGEKKVIIEPLGNLTLPGDSMHIR